MIVVFGGTGALGSEATRQLLAMGEPVRVVTRTPERAGALGRAGADLMSGDLLEDACFPHALRGARCVLAAAHGLFGRGREASPHVDGEAHCRLIDVAAERGVEHFVYTSAHLPHPAYAKLPIFRAKLQCEAHLARSGLSHTILRPTAFMDQHAHLLIGLPVLNRGKVTLFGKGETPRNLVAAADVARVAVHALTDRSLAGETLAVGGPENLTHMDVVRLYERHAGRPAKVRHAPLLIPQAMAPLLRPFHPGFSQVLSAAVLAETADQRFDAAPLAARFALEMTRLEDWAAERIAAEGDGKGWT